MKIIWCFLIFVSFFCSACTVAPSHQNADVSDLRQVITADSKKSRTIMWRSQKEDKEVCVEYRQESGGKVLSLPAKTEPYKDGKANCFLYKVQLTDLTPGTNYEYRIVSASKTTPWQRLFTDGSDGFKALLFPDSQSNDYSGWKQLVNTAWKKNPQAEFFINMGDLVDNGEDDGQWRDWFSGVKGMIESIPVAPVLGNHECYTLDWKVRLPKAYVQLFSLPDNGFPEYRNQFYSFDYGFVHFVVLDTQVDEMAKLQPNMAADQKAWLQKDLRETKKIWKVVLMHKDVLRYAGPKWPDRQPGFSTIGESLMPIFDENGVDAVLTAHYHTYRRRGRIYDFQRSEKGPLYIITGVAGNVRYPGLWSNHPLDVAVAPQPETDNYMTLEASAHTLRFTCYLHDGTEIDKAELHKSN